MHMSCSFVLGALNSGLLSEMGECEAHAFSFHCPVGRGFTAVQVLMCRCGVCGTAQLQQ